MSQFDELPEGWVETTLGELGNWSSGGTPLRKHSEYYEGDIPWVKTGDLTDGMIEEIDEFITDEGLKNSSAKIFPKSSLLVAMYGATIGKLGILKHSAATNQACAALLSEGLTEKLIPFAFYYLLSSREELRKIGQGGAQPNISQTILKEYVCPLPPVNEQRRIVEKIEALTARSRKARAALDEIPALLDQFRQSVLAAAFRGDLTADWRAQNSNVEPAEALLERIRVERRKRWEEAELEKIRAKGKDPKNDNWNKKYTDFKPENIVNLPKLPSGWCWEYIGNLGECPEGTVQTGPFGAQLHSSEFVESGVPVIAVGNLTGIDFSTAGIYHITKEKATQLARYDVNSGDVLFARSGATLGKVCVAPSYVKDWRMTGHILRARFNCNFVLPETVYFALAGSVQVVRQVTSSIRGMTRPGYNTNLLESIVIPVPPIEEQKVLIQRIKRAFDRVEYFENDQKSIASSIEHLDQSILVKAFCGQLVPQDPNDEPATVLLDRIRVERERLGSDKKRGKAKG